MTDLDQEKRRAADRIKSATRRRRQREGRVPVLIEIDEVNGPQRLNLGGEPDKRALQQALQAFVDQEVNSVTW